MSQNGSTNQNFNIVVLLGVGGLGARIKIKLVFLDFGISHFWVILGKF